MNEVRTVNRAGIAVLLVDDHAVVRAGYRRLLETVAGIRITGEAERGETAYAMYADGHYDVVILDMSLPGIGGLEVARRILRRDPEAKILVCSIHEEAMFVRCALEAGVIGYVSKSSPPDVLIEAVEQVAAGRRYVSAGLLEQLAHAAQADDSERLAALTAREFEIFRLLASGETVRDIARTLCISGKTVANYNTEIRKKLHAANAADLARLAMRNGVISG